MASIVLIVDSISPDFIVYEGSPAMQEEMLSKSIIVLCTSIYVDGFMGAGDSNRIHKYAVDVGDHNGISLQRLCKQHLLHT